MKLQGSAVVAFISQTSSKLGRDPPAAAAAFEPSPALMVFKY
jgi:hypothetical protein